MFDTIRDFLSEFIHTVSVEIANFARTYSRPPGSPSEHLPSHDVDIRRTLASDRSYDLEAQLDRYNAHAPDIINGYALHDAHKNEPFEFYKPVNPDKKYLFDPHRSPAPGILSLPFRFHKQSRPTATSEIDSHVLDPILSTILYSQFPQYLFHTNALCRPDEIQDSTFSDFNKEQKSYPPVPPSIISRIIPLICLLMNALPFRPLHYVDSFFTKLPLSTGVSYFYRQSYDLRAHALFAHNRDYATKPTSKGYFLNSFTLWARSIVHKIKEHGMPFSPDSLSPSEQRSHLRSFFMQHATMLFTRSQISKTLGPYKLRPVYAMDTLFLALETMITFPLHVLARSTKSCVLFSLESIRGGCARIDFLSQNFRTYLCIDWSSFDQRVPFIIIDLFWTVFLPSLIVISHGYLPTTEYSTYPGLTPDMLFNRIFNIICFLRTWYFNCVFLTHDGYAFVRLFAGIASGMLNTQYLDSFCNLFLMLHALIHYGCTDEEILQIMFFVLGDDNVLLTSWDYKRLRDFLVFLETHSLLRFGMVLSPTKSLLTSVRSRIEVLGYTVNLGSPRRPIDKLVAQLCYPEHSFNPGYMSDRAIGIAYAAAGSDTTFHAFCKSVHDAYLPYRIINPDIHSKLHHLPGFMRAIENISDIIDLTVFPTQFHISTLYSTWQGELPQDRKWSPSHFLSSPAFTHPNSVTMMKYMADNAISFPPVPDLFSEVCN
jgi:hypothetical protein